MLAQYHAIGNCHSSSIIAAAYNEEYGMGATFASLQSISNSPVLTCFLNISANGSSIPFAPSFKNAGCVTSGPGIFGSLCTV